MLEPSTLSTTPPSTTPAPVAPEERSPSLDILRGFCLLGILLTNITHFVGLEFQPREFFLNFTGERVNRWTDTFVTSSFRPSLSLLFGLGFALQLRRNPKAIGRFSRRLLVLLAFGLVHGFLIWNGDILTEYALVGFLLIPFANRKNVTVIAWSLAVFLFFPVTTILYNALKFELDYYAIADTFMNGNFSQVLQTNILVYQNRLVISIMYITQTISCFLLGLWLGRVGALEKPQRHRGFLLGAFAVMLLCAWWGYRISRENFFLDVLFASPTLGFAYIAALSLLISFMFFQKMFYFFSYIGRMALTTYITDSVILSFLFYGYGLGWYGQFYSGEWLYVVLVLFTAQIIFSWLWLKFFRIGPLEWLWRSLTYGRFQPIRKGTAITYSSFGLEKTTEPLGIPQTTEHESLLETFPSHEESKLETSEETLEAPEVTDWQKELGELSEPSSEKSQTLEEASETQGRLEETNHNPEDEKIIPK